MSSEAHPDSGLTESVWSDADFATMGWHDVTVHAFCLQPGLDENPMPRLLLDLDYLLRWVRPVPPERNFSFWIAPATLVFEDCHSLVGDLDFRGTLPRLELSGLTREPPESEDRDPEWCLVGHDFELTFHAAGFRQYVRRAPVLARRSTLTPVERGGVSFAETPFD
ncbi:hypothetical protein RM844_10945 [Streptomyces sp. DSM 44915]|uniref:Uncharacterized protein n=1 Tax=Streptomyces chisholmiae TaxID=3075540 RepID=A0ABU2JQL6_9ACTN|nr:hypothetical protein [Streptomyces sp. DSM 44915]MDT0266809.1 hypothetical protein [Streptomyces sp. DSM 44915]